MSRKDMSTIIDTTIFSFLLATIKSLLFLQYPRTLRVGERKVFFKKIPLRVKDQKHCSKVY